MRRNNKRKSKMSIYCRLGVILAGFFVLLALDGRIYEPVEKVQAPDEEKDERFEIINGKTKGYTVKINELVFTMKSKDEVIQLLKASKERFDPEDEYEVRLKMDQGRMLEAITAYLEPKDKNDMELSDMDGGVARILDDVMAQAGEAVSQSMDAFDEARAQAAAMEDYNGTDANVELSLEALVFADAVEIAVTYTSPEDLTNLQEAIEQVNQDKQKEEIYEVQPGDTLSEIALSHDLPMDQLVEINETLESEDSMIRAGDELVITVPQPELSYVFTQRMYYEENYNAPIEYVDNDEWYTTDQVTLQDPVTGYHRVIADVTFKNNQEIERTVLKEQIVMEPVAKIVERGTKIPPTYLKPISGGRLSSGFGKRSAPTKGASTYHKGIDWATPVGTAVTASCGGVVSRAGWGSGYGNVVFIDHPDGRQTRYGHLSKVLVKPGDRVSQGQKIALSGNTGRSTGPHLHFEILVNGGAVNPLEIMK